MAMVLPKGIIKNDPEIYVEVASYSLVPPERIWCFWQIYTTTSGNVLDPTAYRLEHFWWHVLGSDRRYLSGPVLARLFQQISIGPTFVPLGDPASRLENAPSAKTKSRGAMTKPPARRPQPGLRMQSSHEEKRSLPERQSLKEPTPSSSRPPPAHPILKKARGPSSGPRPTARFVSPPASEIEGGNVGASSSEYVVVADPIVQSPQPRLVPVVDVEAIHEEPVTHGTTHMPASHEYSSTAAAAPPVMATVAPSTTAAGGAEGLMPPPRRPLLPRTGRGAARKMIASTAVSKRRPAMPLRRQSSQSQSSGGSGSDGGTALITKQLESQRQMAGAREPSPVESTESPTHRGRPAAVPSAKAAGKQPVRLPPPDVVQPSKGSLSSQGDSSQPPFNRVGATRQSPTAPTRRENVLPFIGAPRASPVSSNHANKSPIPIAGFAVADRWSHYQHRGSLGLPSSLRGSMCSPVRAPIMLRSHSNIETTSATAGATAMTTSQGRRRRDLNASRFHTAPSRMELLAKSVVATSTMTARGRYDAGSASVLVSVDNSTQPLPIGSFGYKVGSTEEISGSLLGGNILSMLTGAVPSGGSGTAAPTFGTPDDGEVLLPNAIIAASRRSSSSASSSLLDLKQFTPTQPSSAPPIPFGRSKSQLTLVLEREKERMGADGKQR